MLVELDRGPYDRRERTHQFRELFREMAHDVVFSRCDQVKGGLFLEDAKF